MNPKDKIKEMVLRVKKRIIEKKKKDTKKDKMARIAEIVVGIKEKLDTTKN